MSFLFGDHSKSAWDLPGFDDKDYFEDLGVGNVPGFLKGSIVDIVLKDGVTDNIADENCPNPFATDWEEAVPALHNADPNLYIIPVLMGSPHQQFAGLKDTMALDKGFHQITLKYNFLQRSFVNICC